MDRAPRGSRRRSRGRERRAGGSCELAQPATRAAAGRAAASGSIRRASGFATAGDRLRPRWANAPAVAARRRRLEPSGARSRSGELAPRRRRRGGARARRRSPPAPTGCAGRDARTRTARPRSSSSLRRRRSGDRATARGARALLEPARPRVRAPERRGRRHGAALRPLRAPRPDDRGRDRQRRARSSTARTLVAGRDPRLARLAGRPPPIAAASARARRCVARPPVDQRQAATSTCRGTTRSSRSSSRPSATGSSPGQSETFRVTVKDPTGGRSAPARRSCWRRCTTAASTCSAPLSVPRRSSLYPSFGAPGALEHELGGARPGLERRDRLVALHRDRRRSAPTPSSRSPYGIGGPGGGADAADDEGRASPTMATVSAPDAAAPAPRRTPASSPRSASVGGRRRRRRRRRWTPSTSSGRRAGGLVDGRRRRRAAADRRCARTSPRPPSGSRSSHRRRRLGGDRVHGPRLGHLVAGLGRGADADARLGLRRGEAESVKELMVRPYLPRFLREGDSAELKVVVNNAGETRRSPARLRSTILDPETETTSLAPSSG